MALLTTATKVYAGSTVAVKVYAGSASAWPSKVAAKLVFPGVTGNYLSVPDAANLDITGDLDIQAYVDPTAAGGWQTLQMDVVGKFLTTGNQRSYRFYVLATGVLQVALASVGSGAATTASSVGVAAAAGPLWIRVTRQAGVVKFYTAPAATTVPTTWTQLGTDRTTSTTGTLFAGTAPVTIGEIPVGGSPLKGRIYRAIIRNSIDGTAVLDVNEDDANANVPGQFTATSGQTVTATVTASNQIIQPRVP